MLDLRARLTRPALLFAAFLLASCGDDETMDPGPDVSSIDVSPASASVTVGHTAQLAATPKDAAGSAVSGATLDFTSSDTAVATVTDAGVVTGVAPGTATMTATVVGVGGVSGSAGITVLASDPTSLVLTSIGSPVVAGKQFAVVAEVQDVLGNPVLAFNGPVTAAIGTDPSRSAAGVPAAMLWGTTAVNSVAGVAAFPDLSLNLAALPYTLAFSALSGGLTVETAQFAVGSALVDLSMSPTAALIPFVSASDDSEEVVGANALDYHWFGTRYTDTGISVGTNGALRLGTNVRLNINPINETFPAANHFDIIGAFWDDLDATGPGDVYFDTTADGFIVHWRAVEIYGISGSQINAEIIYRTNPDPCSQAGYPPCSEVQLVYGMLDGVGDVARATGGSASIGLQNATGSLSHLYSVNTANAVREGYTITYAWDGTAGNYVRVR